MATLIDDLAACVGAESVLTNLGDLQAYSYDAALDRSLPSIVVLPGTPDQVANVVKILVRYKKPYVARGAGTSLCGAPVPYKGAVVIGLARLTRIGKLDKEKNEIVVEPGVVNLRLQNTVSAAGLFYPPDPGSQKACTIGGNVGTNAGGPHCLKYGVTSHYVVGLDVVLPDGQLVQWKVDDPGYDLTGLFVGSEGTLGIATKIRLRLLKQPTYVRTMLVSFSSIEEAIQSVTDIIAAGLLPATLEAMDRTIVAAVEAFVHAGYPTEAEAILLIEVDGDELAELDLQVKRINEVCEKNNSFEFRFAASEAERAKLWEGRRGSYAAMARLAPNVLVEDGAVPRTKLPEALARIQEIADRADLRVALLFHAGDGNLHPQIIFDERNVEETKRVKQAGYDMLKACVDLGGTISGEHGIGIDKREAMKWLFSRETLILFRRLKVALDPENFCNPDKLLPLVSKAPPPAPSSEESKPAPMEKAVRAEPATEKELALVVSSLYGSRSAFGIQGTVSKFRVLEGFTVKTTKLDQVVDFDRGNLTVTAQGGALIAGIRDLVAKDNQFLWVAGEGTVGGVIATRASVAPPLRDLILEMKVMLCTGEIVRFGAKTMKNVAGYDAAKLLIGSWGTLGIITEVTFRLFPYPAKQLKAEKTKPFLLRPIHQKIKTAFDPAGIISPRSSTFKPEDLLAFEKGDFTKSEDPATPEFRNLEDRFWR